MQQTESNSSGQRVLHYRSIPQSITGMGPYKRKVEDSAADSSFSHFAVGGRRHASVAHPYPFRPGTAQQTKPFRDLVLLM